MKRIIGLGIIFSVLSSGLFGWTSEEIDLSMKGCKMNDSAACYMLGLVYSKGYGVEQDKGKSEEFFKKYVKLEVDSCESGNAYSCTQVAFAYSNGTGVQKDEVKAKKFYKKACDMGDTNGCESYSQYK
jgi:TPR repeat protein